jgi:transposase-like protein
MTKKRHHSLKEKKSYIKEIISGYRTEYIARKHGVHPESMRLWVRQYGDEVEEEMVKQKQKEELIEQVAVESGDTQKKYNQALKLLGEKDLEIAILRDLLKKTNPDALKGLK